MASLFTNETFPADSEAALREFDEHYLLALTSAQPSGWQSRFIENVTSTRVTYPMSYFTARFQEAKTEAGTFDDMAEDSFDLKVVEHEGGHEARLMDLQENVFAYRRWQSAPAEMLIAEAQFQESKLAALLETGGSVTSPFDGVNFFSASHKANPKQAGSSTWSNYQSSTLDPASVTNLTAEIINMKGVLDLQGQKMPIQPDEIWLPTEKAQKVANLLNQQNLASGESNPMFGKLRVVEIPKLTDTNDWYLVDSKLMARLPPMLGARFQPSDSLGIRTFDESSDYFLNTGRIKKSYRIWYGFGFVFPHAIRLVKGA